MDGGDTWEVQVVSVNPNLGIISGSAVSTDSAWALTFDFDGGGGQIFATSDGGSLWIQQDSGLLFTGLTSFPNFIHFWNSLEGIAVGDPSNGYYEIYRTMDGGNNWIRVDSVNIPSPFAEEAGLVNDFSVINDNIWYGASSNKVYHSTNRGETWTVNALNGENEIAGPVGKWKKLQNLLSF